MSALEEPSRDPSRPLTPCVVSRHRQSVPVPTASIGPRARSRAHVGPLDRETRIVPPSPRCEEPSPLRREDGGTTQGAFRRVEATACLRRSARHFSPADPTPLGAGQSDSFSLPCDVRAPRVRTVLLGYRSFLRNLCGVTSRLATRGPTAPRDPSASGRWAHCPPRQRFEQCATGWPALLRPGLRRCAEHELRCIRPTSASQPFSTTSTHASRVPSISSRLAPRPFALVLLTRMTEAGGPGVSRRPIRFGGWLGLARGVLLPLAPDSTEPLTPLSLPDPATPLFAEQ